MAEFYSSNHLGEGDFFNYAVIVSTIGISLELFWLIISSFTHFDYNFCTPGSFWQNTLKYIGDPSAEWKGNLLI
jgi:hypothetical protein